MSTLQAKSSVHPVGIDLGTTYSCISYLTPQGQPVTIPNSEGEMATPSIVLFDGDDVIVGTEALRNAVTAPERVVSQAKRHMGDPNKCWVFDGHVYRPADIQAFVLRKLLDGAEDRLGTIRHAVITVPAQFSDIQRQQTVQAGLDAGLERVDIINEPVAAALCYVLSEGMWFAEIANEQTIMVFDLGGGTFDLSLVKYNKSEVRVVASGGDLNLGGLDWNKKLQEFACDEFIKESISDPRLDRESMQALSIEVEQVKRSLSVRPKATIVVQHDGRRKAFPIDRERFELLANDLVQRTEDITKGMLKVHKMGWAHVDSVLVTGGASRMPMVRSMLQRISGTTLNTALSPDQSICHGAAYYAGMLLSGQRLQKSSLNQKASAKLGSFRQQSVSGRSLGILVRDMETGERVPHYLIPANTPLPCAYQQKFGTVVESQGRVWLRIVESGTSEHEPAVELGDCIIESLSPNLPKGSPIEVTIRYDEQGIVHVEAMDVVSRQTAKATIQRDKMTVETPPKPSSVPSAQSDPELAAAQVVSSDVAESAEQPVIVTAPAKSAQRKRPVPQSEKPKSKTPSAKKRPAAKSRKAKLGPPKKRSVSLESAERPIPLCNDCGEALTSQGKCPQCDIKAALRSQAKTEKMVVPPQRPAKKKPKAKRRPKQ